jgi:hypothetical protein
MLRGNPFEIYINESNMRGVGAADKGGGTKEMVVGGVVEDCVELWLAGRMRDVVQRVPI